MAYFGRPVDPTGAADFANATEAQVQAAQVQAAFSASQESLDLYGPTFNADQVNAIYQVLFGRTAEAAGLADWLNEVARGAFTPAGAAVEILHGALNSDAVAVQNKLDTGARFTTLLGPNASDYSGNDAAESARNFIKTVSTSIPDDSAINATIAALSGTVIPPPVTDQTFTLTGGQDAIPGLIGSGGTTDTTGNDTVSAVIQNSGTNGATNESTLNSTDSLNLGSGTDAINVRVTSLTGSATVVPVLTGLEKVSVSSVDQSGFNAAINLVSSTGTTTVEFKDSAVGSNTTFLNASPTATISLDNADGAPGGQKVNLGSAAGRAGTTDAFSLSIANGTGSSDAFAGFELVASNGSSDDTSFEIANITVAGASSFVMMGPSTDGLTTVNVAGVAAGVTTGFGLTLTQFSDFGSLKTVDASGLSGGGLNIDARGSAVASFAFTGSSADDRIVLANTTISTAGPLAGGGGKDILATTSFNVTPSVVNGTTGFEVLESVNPASSLDAKSFTSINEFLFSGGPNTSRLNITGVESNDLFVFASDQRVQDQAVRFTGATVGNSVVFEMRASSASGGEVTILAEDNTGSDVSAIGFQNNIASVTIDSTGQNSEANRIEAIDNGSEQYFAFNNDNGLSSFTITGSQALTIAAREGVNLSGSTDTLGFRNAANANASSFTGVLRIAGSNFGDVITGGSANDIIYGLSGENVLTGNGGSDQFRLVGANGTDIIKDFLKGNDKVGFNNVDFGNTATSSAGTTLAAADYVDNRVGITSIGNSDDKTVIELQSALSTSQIQTDLGAAVEAYVLVFNSTTNKAELWFDPNWSTASSRDQVATFDNIVSLTGVIDFQNTDFVEFTA